MYAADCGCSGRQEVSDGGSWAQRESGGPNLDRLDVTPQASSLTVVLDDGTPATWRDLGGGVIDVDLPRDREALIHATGATPPLTVAPVPISKPGAAWGLPS